MAGSMHEHNSDLIIGWRAKLYNRLMSIFGARRVYEKALALISLSEGQHLLDIGCGTGSFLKMAQKRFPRARFRGVDASPDMLAEARKNTDPSIIFAEADASFTRGNMKFIELELWRWGFEKREQEWHRGFVLFYLAQRRQMMG